MDNADQSLSTKELMNWHRICRSTVHRLIAKGLPRTKVGARNQFSSDQVDDWFDANWENNPHEWPVNVQLRRGTMLANRMYKEFNAKFFGNRLPHYYVRVVKSIPYYETCQGLCDMEKKLIYMDWVEFLMEDARRAILLHELCHVATPRDPGHGWRFLAQLKRLQRMGEGEWVQDQLEQYGGDGGFSEKWAQRVEERMFDCAMKNPEWTWDEAWKHLGEEFSVDPADMAASIFQPKCSWKQLGEVYKEYIDTKKECIDAKKQIRRVDRLLKAVAKRGE